MFASGDRANFLDLLRQGAELMRLTIDDELSERLLVHWQELKNWSKRINLTAVTSVPDAVEKLYLESVIAAKMLDQEGSVHDVGTGAGFPGLVIKAVYPRRRVLLTEAREKKVFFLREAARKMQLVDGLEIIHGRIGWKKPATLAKDVFSRATFPPKLWLSLAPTLVEPGGRFWMFSSFSGAEDSDAIADSGKITRYLPKGFLPRVFNYTLPFCGAKRQLIEFRAAG